MSLKYSIAGERKVADQLILTHNILQGRIRTVKAEKHKRAMMNAVGQWFPVLGPQIFFD